MADEIYLRLYEELNSYLPGEKRKRRFTYPLNDIRSVHGLLKSLSVPEKEVELVLINGVSVDFSSLLRDGDFVSIYPVFESFDIRSLVRVRNEPIRQISFIAGTGLHNLADFLKMLGFNVSEQGNTDARQMAIEAEAERRTVLTQDSSLQRMLDLSRVYTVHGAGAREQLVEVLSRFDLYDTIDAHGFRPILAAILDEGGKAE